MVAAWLLPYPSMLSLLGINTLADDYALATHVSSVTRL
jgi:hypothetical protein